MSALPVGHRAIPIPIFNVKAVFTLVDSLGYPKLKHCGLLGEEKERRKKKISISTTVTGLKLDSSQTMKVKLQPENLKVYATEANPGNGHVSRYRKGFVIFNRNR